MRFNEIQKRLNEVSPVPIDLPKLYLIGDTGTGKTTVIRKILGSDEYNFPTTRQTRTTVAPTEYVIRKGDTYDITVILKPISEIKGYVDEIIREALLRYQQNKNKSQIVRNLKQTSDQRFRLYYLLSKDFMESVADKLTALLPSIEEKIEFFKEEFPDDNEETDIFVEFALNDLENEYNMIVEHILTEIQSKVKSICNDTLDTTWKIYNYKNNEHSLFINKCKEMLSSELNSISPIIEYARIRGNLVAPWINEDIEAVIIDGEGIGHNTKEAGQLTPRHYDYFYIADTILLIEESKKPFVAGGKNALKSIFERGYKDKLLILFTKLDEVEPYDIEMPSYEDKIEEVKDGLTNVLASLNEDGVSIDLPESKIYFTGGFKDKEIEEYSKIHINNILSYSKGQSSFKHKFIKPEYDFEMLSAFLVESTKKFIEIYEYLLNKEHWKTIEAFNRRMNMGIDGFRMFTPISDFEEKINDEIKEFIAKPLSWAEEVSEKLKEDSLDSIRREFNNLIIDFARNEIISEPNNDWSIAYAYYGKGSTIKRKQLIQSILKRQIPPFTLSQSTIKFKDQIKGLIIKAIETCLKA